MLIYSYIRFRNFFISLLPRLADLSEGQDIRKHMKRWRSSGWSVPLPSLAKRAIIKLEAKKNGSRLFVETGTYLGDTVWFFRNDFDRIYSVEVEPALHRLAQARFRSRSNIEIVGGDSGVVLPVIVSKLNGPALFWLDGHFSSGITGKGETDCPIWKELDAVFDNSSLPHAVLIDDARCFGADAGYPTLEELRAYLARKRPSYKFSVENDIIRFSPP